MNYNYRVTAICPDADRHAMRKISTALGYSDHVFTAPLSPTGDAPATHWAYSTTATAEFVAMQTDPATQEYVFTHTDWPSHGITEMEARDVLARHWSADPAMLMIGDKDQTSGREQLEVMLTGHGLARVVEDDAP